MSKRSLQAVRCVVTGASSGIGRSVACALAREKARMVLTARRASRLDQVADEARGLGAEVTTVAGDVTDPEVRRRVIAAASESAGGLDILINNAGSGVYGRFELSDEARLRRMFEVNFFAATELTRLAIPELRRSDRAMIVNVSSVLGHRAVPNKSEYCAAKFALHGWSDALRAELVEASIDVLLVSPSTTASEFFDQVQPARGVAVSQARASRGRGMSPDVVARKMIAAMRRGRHEIILSPGGKLLVWLDRLFPTFADALVARFG